MTLFGYDQGVFSAYYLVDKADEDMCVPASRILTNINISLGGVIVTDDFLVLHDLVGPSRTSVLSTVTAIYNVGCFLGAVLAFWVGEKIGRKKAVILGTIIMTVGALLQTTSYSLPQMFVGRIILGIGNGINTSTAPIWQTETAKANWRGHLVILEMGCNIFGFMLSNWVNYGLSFHQGSVAWRFPLAFQYIFIIVLFLTVPWLPESPR